MMKILKHCIWGIFPLAFVACSKDELELTPPNNNNTNNENPPVKEVELLTPVDVQATESTKKLYTYLKSVYGKKTFSSTMANVAWNTQEVAHVYNLTKKYPAMNCFDFIHIHHSYPDSWINYLDISPVKNWAEQGGIVSLMWHFAVPEKEGAGHHVFYADKTTFQISNIFIENSWESKFFYEQLNNVCDVLLKLQKSNISALWRPFHEASGKWFWWGSGSSEDYVRLWKLLYDQMQHKGIHNLIWVWTTEGDDDAWYPGDKYVDIVGRDLYGKNATYSYNQWKQISDRYSQKMVSLSECGNLVESNKIISKQSYIEEQWNSKGARWLYFMPWYDYDFNRGTSSINLMCSDDFWIDAMSRNYVLNRDDVRKYFSEVTYKK